MEKTLFEKMVSGELPSVKIYEDESTFAFFTREPITKGHTLVITKRPYKDITEVPKEEYESLMSTIVKLSKAVKEGTNSNAVNVFNNSGKEAGQEVFHLHFHIIPRKHKNEIPPLTFVSYASDTEKKGIAEKIKNSIEN